MKEYSSVIFPLSEAVRKRKYSYDGRNLRVKLDDTDTAIFDQDCDSIGLTFERHLNDDTELQIDGAFDNQTLMIFVDEVDFRNRILQLIHRFTELHLVILNHENTLIEKIPSEAFSDAKKVFFNYYMYHQILHFLINNERFVSVNANHDQQFVIFGAETGPFFIGYDPLESRVKNLDNLQLVYEQLISEFQKVDFVEFFKAAVVTTLNQYTNIKDRFYYLVQSLRVILSISNRDHYVYIKNFDFEKIRKKFNDGKLKYFENLDKSIESLNKQVTSFPLTFAASVFAGYQVKEKPIILILILMAYTLYTIIASKILAITEFNATSVKKDLEHEIKTLETEYRLLYKEFAPEFNEIRQKIEKINSLITTLRTTLWGLIISFVIFSLYQIIKSI